MRYAFSSIALKRRGSVLQKGLVRDVEAVEALLGGDLGTEFVRLRGAVSVVDGVELHVLMSWPPVPRLAGINAILIDQAVNRREQERLLRLSSTDGSTGPLKLCRLYKRIEQALANIVFPATALAMRENLDGV
ncbi:hypothetical protein [Paraburkholderia sp. Cpub6]|uniref:hypothetical protein n=1 Tax=Paraburkholderia sp. Cpub6 TaxID=2723094 RepID=UPI001794B5F5|nr:hypothetical protein [Paraburkholderia sp. Cpub6]MBB5460209.1 hypothetical protein [Paraburkholderia sp. Cpub6]